MPRLSAIPKYCHHKASGQAVVTLNRRDFYLGKFGSEASRREYDRLIAEWLAGGKCLAAVQRSDAFTIVQLAAAFWAHAKQYYVGRDGQPTRELANYKRVLTPLRHMFGRLPVSEFGPLRLIALRDGLIHDGLARKTVNQHIIRLRNVFRWGVANELVPAAVYQALTTVTGLRYGRCAARETKPVQPISEQIVDQTLPHLPKVVADMVRLQRLTGARPEEVCLLRPCDLDCSVSPWQYRPLRHKTSHHGHDRIILIGPKAQAIVRPYLSREPDEYCFSPLESEMSRRLANHSKRRVPIQYGNRPGTNRKVMPKKRPQTRYTTDSYRRAIHRACEVAFGMPPDLRYPHRKSNSAEHLAKLRAEAKVWREAHCWSPNQLRHAAATEIRARFGMDAARTVLGHTTADTTAIYAERDLTTAARVIGEMG